ncbi:uncharacterized protein AMSG_03099 [Thecamonas trahens ATCC 50062]|uniref:Protein unc-45 homolog B n=1 Tax=Thecamonas trahens ATCC 50062 TaxID=461836 RepID=A0A0L0D2W4_THETB|nr:hypothetical protein AMSG_03099 [Thecamonas trahens ATCC 50062]KNC46662.1 hypothetical protein AMSG_03099 [Thecamonas trahens ATCC 50062]|eukprot:XP_013760435.1 hypothetical protein AMSG_03099 [Thecamonas trahens ATCC 50062]
MAASPRSSAKTTPVSVYHALAQIADNLARVTPPASLPLPADSSATPSASSSSLKSALLAPFRLVSTTVKASKAYRNRTAALAAYSDARKRLPPIISWLRRSPLDVFRNCRLDAGRKIADEPGRGDRVDAAMAVRGALLRRAAKVARMAIALGESSLGCSAADMLPIALALASALFGLSRRQAAAKLLRAILAKLDPSCAFLDAQAPCAGVSKGKKGTSDGALELGCDYVSLLNNFALTFESDDAPTALALYLRSLDITQHQVSIDDKFKPQRITRIAIIHTNMATVHQRMGDTSASIFHRFEAAAVLSSLDQPPPSTALDILGRLSSMFLCAFNTPDCSNKTGATGLASLMLAIYTARPAVALAKTDLQKADALHDTAVCLVLASRLTEAEHLLHAALATDPALDALAAGGCGTFSALATVYREASRFDAARAMLAHGLAVVDPTSEFAACLAADSVRDALQSGDVDTAAVHAAAVLATPLTPLFASSHISVYAALASGVSTCQLPPSALPLGWQAGVLDAYRTLCGESGEPHPSLTSVARVVRTAAALAADPDDAARAFAAQLADIHPLPPTLTPAAPVLAALLDVDYSPAESKGMPFRVAAANAAACAALAQIDLSDQVPVTLPVVHVSALDALLVATAGGDLSRLPGPLGMWPVLGLAPEFDACFLDDGLLLWREALVHWLEAVAVIVVVGDGEWLALCALPAPAIPVWLAPSGKDPDCAFADALHSFLAAIPSSHLSLSLVLPNTPLAALAWFARHASQRVTVYSGAPKSHTGPTRAWGASVGAFRGTIPFARLPTVSHPPVHSVVFPHLPISLSELIAATQGPSAHPVADWAAWLASPVPNLPACPHLDAGISPLQLDAAELGSDLCRRIAVDPPLDVISSSPRHVALFVHWRFQWVGRSASPGSGLYPKVVAVEARGKKFMAVAKTLKRRTKIAHELLETEVTYVSSLNALIEVYVKPLRFNAQTSPNPIARAESLDAIFSNVELIARTNETLADSLRERMAEWDPMTTCLGDALKRMAPFLKLYTQYCKNYDNSLKAVAQCSQSKQFTAFLESGHLHPDSLNLHLADALIMPIQRIPRYIMLLSDIIKYTPDDHPDATNLAEALTLISEIARTVNSSMAVADSMNRIVEIQQMLSKDCPILVEPARRFVREGYLTKNREKRMYFLFNDILVYAAKQNSSMFLFKGLIPLNTTWIKDLAGEEVSLPHAFQIVSTKKTYTVCADSESAKASWMADINAQIDELVAKDPSLVARRAEAGRVVKSRFRRKGAGESGAAGDASGSGMPVLSAPATIDLTVPTPRLSYRYLFSGNCDKVGTLCKLGSSRFTRWNNRIFLLKDMFLYYYKTEADEEPTGIVPLDGCIVESRQDISKKNKYYFDISHSTRSRVYHIFAKETADRTEWSNLLLRAINGDRAVSNFGLPFVFCNIAWGPLIVKELALEAFLSVITLCKDDMLDEHYSALSTKDGANFLPALINTLNAEGAVFELGAKALRHASRFQFTHAYLLDSNNGVCEFLGGLMSREGTSKATVGNIAWTLVHLLAPSMGPGPDEPAPAILGESPIIPLVILLERAGDEFMIDAAIKAMAHLAEDAFLRAAFLKDNALKPLVEVLRTASSHVALYYGCLTLSLVSSNDSIRAAIPNLGAIPTLVTHLSSPSPWVIEAALRALSGLASSSHNRVLMTESLFLSPLLSALESNATPSMLAVAMDCIRAFSASLYGKEVILNGGCLPSLVAALTLNQDVKVLTNVAAAIANVTEGGSTLIQSEFRELGGMDSMFAVANNWLPAEPNRIHARLQEAILRVLCNVCLSSNPNIELLVAAPETVAAVVHSLSSPVERVVAQAARLAGEVSIVENGARTLQHSAAVEPLFRVACWNVEGSTTYQASARVSAVIALANLAKSSIVVAHLGELVAEAPLAVADLAHGAGLAGIAARKLAGKLDLDLGVAPVLHESAKRPATPEVTAQSGGRLTLAAPDKLLDPAKAAVIIDSAVAVESWMATSETELNVSTGDVIAVYDATHPEWWYARVGGVTGFVPCFCLETVSAGMRKTTSATLDKAARLARLSTAPADEVVMTLEEEGVRMGYLKLQSTSVLKSWIRHFAVLEAGKLAIYKTVHDPVPVFELDVQVVNVKNASDLTFEMIAPDKRYLFQGETQAEVTAWVAAIRDATASQLRNVTSVGKTGTLKRVHSKTKSQINQLIANIWKLPGNSVCADCFNTKPDWCSINLGILVCIECSGLHRSLGTSISKVRSLKLDDLVPYVEEYMQAIGNEAANSILEAWPSRVIRYKPSDPSLAGMRNQYIKYKYVEKRLLAKGTETDPDKLGAALRASIAAGSHMGILAALAAGAAVDWLPPDKPGAIGSVAYALETQAPRVVVTALVLNNADINSVSPKSGGTPAHDAVLAERSDVLEILMDNNADIKTPNAEGQTVLQLAEALNATRCITILRGETASPSECEASGSAAGSSPPPPTSENVRVMSVTSLPPAPPAGANDNYEDLLALIEDDALPPPPPDMLAADSAPPKPAGRTKPARVGGGRRGSGPPPPLSQGAAAASSPGEDSGAAFATRRPTAKKLPPPAVDVSGSDNSLGEVQPIVPADWHQADHAQAAQADSYQADHAQADHAQAGVTQPRKPTATKPTTPKPTTPKPASPKPRKPTGVKPASPKPAKPAAAKPVAAASCA